MRILVLATAARFGGALTVLESLHDFAVRTGGEHDWVFLVGGPVVQSASNVQVVVEPALQRSRRRRLALDLGFARSVIERHRPDAVLSLHNTMPPGLSARTVLFVQQSIPFQTEVDFSLLKSDERTLAVYQHLIGALIKRSVRTSDLVVVQSQWMRDAVSRSTGVNPADIVIAPPSPPVIDLPDGPARFDPRSFIYPANGASYKNHRVLLEAVRQVPQARLVLTLGEGPDQPGIEYSGRIPYRDLLHRMSGSTLVFPSLFETVGLPLLEARSLGVPVIAADLPYAREMLDGYQNATYFDPHDASALAALMQAVMHGRMVPGQPDPPTAVDGWETVLNAMARM